MGDWGDLGGGNWGLGSVGDKWGLGGVWGVELSLGVPMNPPPHSVTGLHDLDEYIQAQLLLAVREAPPPN